MTIHEIHLSALTETRRHAAGSEPLPALGKRTLAECNAMINALACADKGFTRAGVTFEQTDQQVTLVKHSGHTVAELRGRFGTETVVTLIRKNIAAHARSLVAELNRALTGLVLPAGHTFRLDEQQNVSDIVTRGATTLQGYIGGRVAIDQVQISGEFQFSLIECRAQIRLKAGDRFCEGGSLLGRGDGLFGADTYDELANQVVSHVNASIHEHMTAGL